LSQNYNLGERKNDIVQFYASKILLDSAEQGT
jgi:hypothetical protein